MARFVAEHYEYEDNIILDNLHKEGGYLDTKAFIEGRLQMLRQLGVDGDEDGEKWFTGYEQALTDVLHFMDGKPPRALDAREEGA